MEIFEKRAIEITSLAMNGLTARHKAITSNIANADSADYKKINVNFEDQLKRIIATDDRKEEHMRDNMFKDNKMPLQSAVYDLQYSDFNPEMIISEQNSVGKNNVNLESEMAELAKNGIKYNALAILQQKAFQGLKTIIQQGGRV